MMVATVVTQSMRTNGSNKTTQLTKPARSIKQEDGTMVSAAPQCLAAATAPPVKLATFLTPTSPTVSTSSAPSPAKKP